MTDMYFVPNATAGTRKDTATLLVGTAEEYGINQRSIRTTPSGFYITDELASKVFSDEDLSDEPEAEAEPEPEPEPEPDPKPAKGSKKTSGDRAAKNTGTPKE